MPFEFLTYMFEPLHNFEKVFYSRDNSCVSNQYIGIYRFEIRLLIFLKDLKEAEKVTNAIRKYNCKAIGWHAALTALYR